MIEYMLARLKEASTWRGILGLLTAAGITISPEQIDKIIAAGLAAMGVIGAFFGDRVRKTEKTEAG